MPIDIGSFLGRYRITGRLGSGGMGEVYRARDERLERDVAIKVLHQEAMSDPDRQRRFAQEARAASALNHPNILTVYDVGMEGGIPYIVSELVEGEALGQMISRGPLPIRKAVDIAIQVAGGLAAAHQAGIVHRDLKPANIMMNREGFTKILDFGLAKRFQQQKAALAGLEAGGTTPGFIIGTATYMSPEQVRGDALDHRTDQFSLGLVLYEMITGQAPFARSSAVSTMAAITEEQAKPIHELNPAVPAPLRWCIERCLEKDREERYTSTADLQRELQGIRRHMDEISAPQATLAAAVVPTRRRWRYWPTMLGISGFLAGVLAASAYIVSDPLVNMAKYRIRPVSTSANYEGSPAWSADGKSITYTGDVNGVRQVFVRDLSSPMASQITNSPVDCERPFWSPDDNRIYYFAHRGSALDLYAVGATGGSPQLMQQNASSAAIAPDGKTLVFLRADPTGNDPLSAWTVAGSGAAKRITGNPFSASSKYDLGQLAFTRDGTKLGIWLERWDGGSEFWILSWPDAAASEPFSLRWRAYPFSWMPDGKHIVFGGVVPGSMGADLQRIDIRTGRMEPLSMLTKDALEAAVSPDGRRIAFRASEDNFDILVAPVDGSAARPLLGSSRNEFDPTWSPNGDQVAYATDRTGTSQIWFTSPAQGWERPLVTEADFGQTWITSFSEPNFSPDGRRIAYSVAGSSGHSVYISSVAGGKPVRLSTETSDERSPTWNGDGSWIAYLRNINGRWALVKASSGGGATPVVVRDAVLPVHPKWNRRNSHWIACVTSGGLTVVSEDGKEANVLSTDRWAVFGWSADGKTIYGIKEMPNRSRVVASLDIETKAQKVLGELHIAPEAELRSFSLAPDGKSFATSVSHPAGDIWILEGFERPGWLPWAR